MLYTKFDNNIKNKNKKQLYVLMVTNVYFPVFGGISSYIKDLTEEIENSGVEVQIVTFPAILNRANRILRWLFYLGFITKVLLTVLWMCLLDKRPIVHSHSASFCLASSVASKWLFGCKAVHTYHSPLKKNSWFLSSLTVHLDKVVYVSNAARDLHRSFKVPVHTNEAIIPGGIQISKFPIPDFNLRFSLSPPRILFVGRICKEKGVKEAIETIGLMKNKSILEIVGTAQTKAQNYYLSNLKQIVSNSSFLSYRVRFIGMLLGKQLIEAYSRALIFICPSIWEEPISLVVAEAMAASLPVIAFNTGGLHERIRNGKDGILIPKGDIKTFATVLDELLIDKIRLQRMSILARKHSEIEFDRSIMSQRYIQIYTTE